MGGTVVVSTGTTAGVGSKGIRSSSPCRAVRQIELMSGNDNAQETAELPTCFLTNKCYRNRIVSSRKNVTGMKVTCKLQPGFGPHRAPISHSPGTCNWFLNSDAKLGVPVALVVVDCEDDPSCQCWRPSRPIAVATLAECAPGVIHLGVGLAFASLAHGLASYAASSLLPSCAPPPWL